MAAVVKGNQIQIRTGAGVSIRSVNHKELSIRDVEIVELGPNKFQALFEEDDVDFMLCVHNYEFLGAKRGLAFTVDTSELGSGLFYVEPRSTGRLETLHSNGQKFHFVSQSTAEGQKIVKNAAKKLNTSLQQASHKVSKMDIGFQVEELKEKKLMRRNMPVPIEVPLHGEIIKVFVKPFEGDKITIEEIGIDNTIENLKSLIKNEGYRFYYQEKLIFEEKFLEDEKKTLSEYNIEDGSTIYISKPEQKPIEVPLRGETMKVLVKTLTAKIIEIIIGKENTIEDLKCLITNKEGIPVDQQRLVFAGNQLENDNTLSSYFIKDGETVHLVLRLRGGGGYAVCSKSPALNNAEALTEKHVRGAITSGGKSEQEFEYYGGFAPDMSIRIASITIEFHLKSK